MLNKIKLCRLPIPWATLARAMDQAVMQDLLTFTQLLTLELKD